MRRIKSDLVVERRLVRGMLAGVFAGLFLAACATQDVGPQSDPVGRVDAAVRQISQGAIRGVHENGSLHFRGIPFAQAPVGELRWKPPQPPADWSDVRDASAFGPVCMQRASAADVNMSEDCLSLNVSVPDDVGRDEKLPVLVRIHGGGFVRGSGPGGHSADVWNREDVVLVTMNYRLGALGIFDHPLLRTEAGEADNAANFALLDLKAALEWVRANISSFNGDPDRVTITGVSAGGEAVDLLLVMPGTEGLFDQAIVSSGYVSWPMPVSPSVWPSVSGGDLPDARNTEKISEAIASRAAGAEPATADALRNIDAAALVAAIDGFHMPMIDGVTVVDDPVRLFAEGRDRSVPLMTGGNSYEGSVFPASGVSAEDTRALLGDAWDAISALYADDFAVSEELGITRMFGDMRYVLASQMVAAETSKRAPTFLYFVTYVPEGRRGDLAGAPHGGETPLFERGGAEGPGPTMLRYWANFVRTGDPNGDGLPRWTPTTPDEAHWIVFGDDITSGAPIAEKLRALTAARAGPAWAGVPKDAN